MPKWLSKSRYLNGLQCPKLLWISANDPGRMPEIDDATQQIFDQGHLVGELARQLYPDGVTVPDDDFIANIRLTKAMLKDRKTLFEAGLQTGRLYSRVDILRPAEDGEWDIVEVKSATSVKDVNIDDVSFQKLVCENSGIKIHKCFLAYLNNQYIRHGDINVHDLFTITDITDQVLEREEGIKGRVTVLLDAMDSPVCPEAGIGPHCSDPYDCLFGECWDSLPEHSVFTLYYGGSKAYDLYRDGIIEIKDIPEEYKLNGKQQIQLKAVIDNETHLDKAQIRDFLSGLVYPLYYLDFETIGPAVPLFDNSRPYQNIPFQYSLHIQGSPGGKTEHHEFLAEGQEDPRPKLLESLHNVIGGKGSIVTYNKSFEEKRLEEMAEAFPEYTAWVADVNSRMVDLIVPFRGFHYYNPEQKGSASLKYVLPAITGKGYRGMDIAEGGEASRRFYDITFGEVSQEEVRKTRKALIEYCGQDTEGMVWIVDELWNMTSLLL